MGAKISACCSAAPTTPVRGGEPKSRSKNNNKRKGKDYVNNHHLGDQNGRTSVNRHQHSPQFYPENDDDGEDVADYIHHNAPMTQQQPSSHHCSKHNSQSTLPSTRDLPTLSSITSRLDSLIVSPTSLPSASTSCSTNLQHISEREPDDIDCDPSSNPRTGPLFMQRSSIGGLAPFTSASSSTAACHRRSDLLSKSLREKRQSQMMIIEARPLRKFSSCSTIFLDDSTVTHPNLKNIIKAVSQAIYTHIDNSGMRVGSTKVFDIFDERIHPLSRDSFDIRHLHHLSDYRSIYRFMRTLFNAAQLPPECAIITLVYVERLLTYAETDIDAFSWKRIVLGAILLASKVWDDQAVWNIDYCQILRDIVVEDVNDLERQFLELLQFNINVPQSVYAKYYFDLRTFSEPSDLTPFLIEPLDRMRALKMEVSFSLL